MNFKPYYRAKHGNIPSTARVPYGETDGVSQAEHQGLLRDS